MLVTSITMRDDAMGLFVWLRVPCPRDERPLLPDLAGEDRASDGGGSACSLLLSLANGA